MILIFIIFVVNQHIMGQLSDHEQKMFECLNEGLNKIKEDFKNLLESYNIDLDNYATPAKSGGEFSFAHKLGYDVSDLPSEVFEALGNLKRGCDLINSDKK